MSQKARSKPQVIGLLGVGLDNDDGHKRVTRSDNIVVVGGSEETHSRMQDVVIHFTESLKDRGKRLRDAAPDEISDLLRQAMEQ